MRLAVSGSGELKVQAFCISVVPVPIGCGTDSDIDHTPEVDGSNGQPALLAVHGTADTIVPYVNGKAVVDQALKVGIKAKLITIPGAGHIPFAQLFQPTHFTDFMTFIADAMDLAHAECPKTDTVI